MSTEKDVEAAASELSPTNVDAEDPPSYGTVDDLKDGPPSYYSLFGDIQKAGRESEGNVDFAKKVSTAVAGSVGCTISMVFMLAVPIAMIAIGAKYLHDCPIQRMIPIYLVVMGCFTVVKNLIGLGERCRNHREGETENNAKPNPLDGILGCFIFAWFIAGNVWIYSVYKTVNMSASSDANYCQPTLYLFAFWVTTATYIFIGLMICCCCCITCAFATNASKFQNTES